MVDHLWHLNTTRLSEIIRPVEQPKYGCDVDWRDLATQMNRYRDSFGGLEINPDFQRGHVWNAFQQKKFIESVIRGAISASALHIQWNCPNWENDKYEGDLPRGFQCIDGLQRLTSVAKFLKGELRPFGLTIADLDHSRFQIKNRYSFRFQIFCFEKKVDVLDHYLDFNDGGVAHSQDELARVRSMRDAIGFYSNCSEDCSRPNPAGF